MGQSMSVMPASQVQTIVKVSPSAALRLPAFSTAQRFFVRVHPLWLQIQKQFRRQGIGYSDEKWKYRPLLELERTMLAFMGMLIQMTQVRFCILAEGQWKQLATVLIEYMKQNGHIAEQGGQGLLVGATIDIIDLERLILDKFQQITFILGWHAQVTHPASFLAGLQLSGAITAEQQVLSERVKHALFDRYINVFKNLHMFSCWSQQPSKEEAETLRAMLHIAQYDVACVRTMLVMMYQMHQKKMQSPWQLFPAFLDFINARVAAGQELLALSTEECNQLFANMLGDYLVKYAAASWLFLALCAHKKDVTVPEAKALFQAYSSEKKYLPRLCGCTLELDLEQCSLEAVHRQLQILGLIPQGRQPGVATIECVVHYPMFEQLTPSLTDCATIHVPESAFHHMFESPRTLSAENRVALCGPRSRKTPKTPPQSPTAPAVTQQSTLAY